MTGSEPDHSYTSRTSETKRAVWGAFGGTAHPGGSISILQQRRGRWIIPGARLNLEPDRRARLSEP
jgi:hypothetical protein